MLVNHLVRCHPDTPLNSIPELNLPLMRAQKEFHCLHCKLVVVLNLDSLSFPIPLATCMSEFSLQSDLQIEWKTQDAHTQMSSGK